MGKNRVNVLIIGANASQGVYANPLFGSFLLSSSVEIHVTFYDRRKVPLKSHHSHLLKAVEQGHVTFVYEFPSEQEFDVVIIAVSSEQHVPALREALDKLRSLPSLLVLEKPLGVSEADLRWYGSVSKQIEPFTVVNEPYHFLHSMAKLLHLAKAKPVAEVNAWASKKRGVILPHGGLEVFAVEFPHLHGAASQFAGRVLSVADCTTNEYYRLVQGKPDNDGNFARFAVNGVVYTVAQGLGAFVMDRHGNMQANNNPPRTRKLQLNYVDGSYVVLDVEPAFSPVDLRKGGVGELHFYDSNDKLQKTEKVADEPRRFFTKFIVRRALNPQTSIPSGVGLRESLERNAALLRLRAATTTITGKRIP